MDQAVHTIEVEAGMGPGYDAGVCQELRSHAGVEPADPHGWVTWLMDGAVERLEKARAHMMRGEVAAKAQTISSCIETLATLRISLGPQMEPALVQRLDSLYEYMSRRLLQANLRDDATILDEVSKLLRQVRQSWAQIAPTPSACAVGA